jgi:glc operon protein GlcG
MPLNLQDAEKVIEAAQARATALDLRVSIAVVDEGAHLIALKRMDGAAPISPLVAEGKAVGAAMFFRDGASLLSIATDRPVFYNAVSGMARTRIVPGPGSVLIKRGGVVVGAVGVSGAKPEQDLECAEAGLASLA